MLLSGEASVDWVVSYLALLDGGHVPLLAGGQSDRLIAAWSPAATVVASSEGVQIEYCGSPGVETGGAGPDLHPELALLLSTSGSTGDPKLVRLSHSNLSSNARAIGDFLGLGPQDCGITSLPLHYCYGLSVLHSHLMAGASVVLSTASVVDPCFRDAMRRHAVTNVAGVPHTFDLLDQAGPDAVRVPSLRFLTQAGGKLPADSVRRWLDRTASWGADFIVMYGQTEATARMAYLPPHLGQRRPDAIGVPIDGGSFRIEPDAPSDPPEVGELVYRGPNVMLGYATCAADLAAGRTVDELRTGDIARYHADDGVYEIVGRRARFIKPFGLRVDLDALERDLSGDVAVAGDDDGVVVCALESTDPLATVDAIVRRTDLPRSSVVVMTASTPRTATDKTDYQAIIRLGREDARRREASTTTIEDPSASSTTSRVAAVYRSVLGHRDVTPSDSFVSLGGDSLSYIECSIRLEHVLGRLPADWHLRPIAKFEQRRRGRFVTRVDTTLTLRAIAICLVVATHMHLAFVPGGAHLLLAVVGYNLARFMSPIEPTRQRVLAGARTAARVAIPTMLWVGGGLLLGATYGLGTLLLVNNYIGPASHSGDHWHFWFIEVVVHVTVLTIALMAIPAVRRADRRFAYTTASIVFVVLLILRWEWAQMGDWYNLRFRTHGVAWLVGLGWLVQRSDTRAKRLVTAAAIVLTVPGFFDYPPRERFIAASLLVLLFLPEIPIPRVLMKPTAALAAASMWIYITHFTFWPPLVDLVGTRAAYVPTILGGIAVWAVFERSTPFVARRCRLLRSSMSPILRRPSHIPTARID